MPHDKQLRYANYGLLSVVLVQLIYQLFYSYGKPPFDLIFVPVIIIIAALVGYFILTYRKWIYYVLAGLKILGIFATLVDMALFGLYSVNAFLHLFLNVGILSLCLFIIKKLNED